LKRAATEVEVSAGEPDPEVGAALTCASEGGETLVAARAGARQSRKTGSRRRGARIRKQTPD